MLHKLTIASYVLAVLNTLLELGWSAIVIHDYRSGYRIKRRNVIMAYIGVPTGIGALILFALHQPL